MTTGPIHIDEWSTPLGTWQKSAFNYGLGICQTGIPVPKGMQHGRVREDRPISTSVPYGPDGFRVCAPYYHFGSSWAIGSGKMVTFTGNPPGCPIIGEGRIFRPYIGFDPLYGEDVSSNLKNASLQACLQKIKDGKAQLSVFLAELGKAGKMVDNRLLSIARSAQRYQNRYPKGWKEVKRWQRGNLPRKWWCNIPSLWLELQYGWKPLMSDIVGVINWASSLDQLPTVSAHATKRDSSGFSSVAEWESGIGGSFIVPPSFKYHREDRCTTYLYYELVSADLRSADQLGVLNPAELVWELLPYSFVVDWALPVGGWLSSLTADAGLAFKTGGTSSKVRVTPAGSSAGVWYPGVSGQVTMPRLVGKTENFRRACYQTPPVPGFYVKNPLSTLHLANGLSLLTQVMRR